MDTTTETTFTARSYRGEEDLQPICDLMNLCRSVDQLGGEEYATPDYWRIELGDPEIDTTRDVKLWENKEGELVGALMLWTPRESMNGKVDAHLHFRLHPDARNKGLEGAILEAASRRVREIAGERNQPAIMRAGLDYSTPEYIAYQQGLLDEQGFAPERYFFKMARPLGQPVPEPHFPAGFTMRHSQGEADIEPWVDAFNQSFIDHWNHHPMLVESHRNWLQSPNYTRERDLICLAPDGTFAAFCFCWIDLADNIHSNRKEGWIDMLGTRRGFRNMGLGRAMLLAGMQRLKADGMDTAVLGVDAENPSGALKLYESVGFYKVHTTAVYQKEL
ncbi:MAG: GNAT family N-acetyltransferase [Chloroflexi bacterium]|nr:GNAT family N-acetyltransferase [Chloroflexota bacterium]